jgi:hypothetical protein
MILVHTSPCRRIEVDMNKALYRVWYIGADNLQYYINWAPLITDALIELKETKTLNNFSFSPEQFTWDNGL